MVPFGVDEDADLVDVIQVPLALGPGEGFDLPGIGGEHVGRDLDFRHAAAVAGELGQVAAPPEAGGVELVHVGKEEVAGAVDDGHAVHHFHALGAVGVDVHDQLGPRGGEGAVEILHPGAGHGVVLVAAVDDHDDEVADLVLGGDLLRDLELPHGVGAGIVGTGGAELHFADVDQAELDAVLLEAQGFRRFFGVGARAHGLDPLVMQDLHGGKDARARMVAGVVVGHEGDLETAFGEETFAAGLHQQIGTALADGSRGVRNDRFPLDDAQIGVREGGFDPGQNAGRVTFEQVGFSTLVGADVARDGDLDLTAHDRTDPVFAIFRKHLFHSFVVSGGRFPRFKQKTYPYQER